jgi:hypothetical protein
MFVDSSVDVSQYVLSRIPRGHSRPLHCVALLLEAQLVRSDGDSLGHAGATLQRPQLIRTVVQTVVNVVMEMMEQLNFARGVDHEICDVG